ncbi:hypothetical protein F908_00847 [Acinetobacter sp. NIPH 284]|jgi:hypothetical protein|uniref:hypothetical protein n=1 Tax=unclassified Acinetobacter TaxID=196816 RepID=UPI0002D0B5B1|nr:MULTISPECIES: hypothetical protein [unclassified Acinetobacter]AZM38753.1 hypothetical protein EJP75_09510 [Acinetobacter baumannii]ENW83945.1 hypothetical protein F908_00847 [Acinetobacter sp. NIPH 284]
MKNLSYFILFFSCACHAGDYNFFTEVNDDTEEMFDSAYPQQEKTDYSILHNLFFQDDRWRVYNYTAYQTNQFNQKMLTGDTSNLSLGDFSISLGYGMVYQLNKNNRIGYEYLSSFPFDRGQLIRLFWLRIF